MARFTGTLLPQSSDSLENQKAILDLLSKINKVYDELTVSSGLAVGTSTTISAITSTIQIRSTGGELIFNGSMAMDVTAVLPVPSDGLVIYLVVLQVYSATAHSITFTTGTSGMRTVSLTVPTGSSIPAIYPSYAVYVDKHGNVLTPSAVYA